MILTNITQQESWSKDQEYAQGENLPENLLSPPDMYRMDISYLRVVSSFLKVLSAMLELPPRIILHIMKNQGSL